MGLCRILLVRMGYDHLKLLQAGRIPRVWLGCHRRRGVEPNSVETHGYASGEAARAAETSRSDCSML